MQWEGERWGEEGASQPASQPANSPYANARFSSSLLPVRQGLGRVLRDWVNRSGGRGQGEGVGGTVIPFHDLNSFRLHDIFPSPLPPPPRFSRCLFNRDVVDVSYGLYFIAQLVTLVAPPKCLSSVETCQIFGWEIYLNYVIKFRNLIVI